MVRKPACVRNLCTLFVSGFIQAASFVSRVVNPEYQDEHKGYMREESRIKTWLDGLEDLLLGVQLAERRGICRHNLVNHCLAFMDRCTHFRTPRPRSRLCHQVLSQLGPQLSPNQLPYHPYALPLVSHQNFIQAGEHSPIGE